MKSGGPVLDWVRTEGREACDGGVMLAALLRNTPAQERGQFGLAEHDAGLGACLVQYAGFSGHRFASDVPADP